MGEGVSRFAALQRSTWAGAAPVIGAPHAESEWHHRAPWRAHDPRRRQCGAAPQVACRPDRPQRRGQVDPHEGDDRPDRSRQWQPRHATRHPHRLYRAGSAERADHADRGGAGRRCRARRLARGERDLPRSRSAGRDPRAAGRDRCLHRTRPRRAHPGRPRLRRGDAAAPARQLFGRLEDARGTRLPALLRARSAAARRAVEPPRSRSDIVAGKLPQKLSGDDGGDQPRARSA